MRVLIVNKYARATGGADRYCELLTGQLRNRGHEVAWLSTSGSQNSETRGAFVHSEASFNFPAGATPLSAARVVRDSLWNRRAAHAMERLIADFRPDVVHAHKLYPHLSVSPVAVAGRRGVPVVQTLHDYELMSADLTDHRGGWVGRRGGLPRRAFDLATYLPRRLVHVRRVDAYIANSAFLSQAYGGRGLETTVVPNAVKSSDGPVGGFEERSGVCFVGRLSEEKGVPDVLGLADRLPGIQVTVAGDGPLAGLVAEHARERENLHWPGWLEPSAVEGLLRRSRVCVLPVHWEEPSGLSALEAFAAGTPVIAYPRGGLAEAVRRSGAGRLTPERESDLAEACSAVHEDPDAWAALSLAGIAATAGAFSLDAWISGIERVYRAVAARSSSHR